MNVTAAAFVSAALLTTALPSQADDFVSIPDASSLKWFQVNASGQIFLRNLNDYDSTFQGCCYNYYIDLNSVAGRALWATLLLKMAASQPIILAVGSKSAGGGIVYAGNW